MGPAGRDLDAEPGEAIGLLGPSGAGKSTLLRVLAGVLVADAGHVEVNGEIASLLSVGAGLMAPLTGRENASLLGVLAGLPRAEATARLEDVRAAQRPRGRVRAPRLELLPGDARPTRLRGGRPSLDGRAAARRGARGARPRVPRGRGGPGAGDRRRRRGRRGGRPRSSAARPDLHARAVDRRRPHRRGWAVRRAAGAVSRGRARRWHGAGAAARLARWRPPA